jgi:hypothetical protein
MIVQRSDAVVILGKWSDEQSRIRCQGSFSTHAFAVEGKIERVTAHEIRMIAGNELTQVVVKLTDEVTFNYADSREITGNEARNYPSCLTLGFEDVPEEGLVDTISFAEISESRPY